MTFSEILNNIKNGMYDNKLPWLNCAKPDIKHENYIFDMNKTFMENRRLVKEWNELQEDHRKAYSEETIRLVNLFYAHIKSAILSNSDMSEDMAEDILQQVLEYDDDYFDICRNVEKLLAK